MHPSQYINYPYMPYPYYAFYPHYEYHLTSQRALNLAINCASTKIQHIQRPYLVPNKRSQSDQSLRNASTQANATKKHETGKRQEKIEESPNQKQPQMQVNTPQPQKKDSEKEGRNANSNLLRMFFRRLEISLVSNSSNIAQVIARHNLKIDVNAFEEWFQINKAQHRKYIRLPMVRSLFSPNSRKNKQEHKIMRVLLLQFLSKQAHAHFLTSKKIKRTNTKYQFQSCRNIISQLR